MTLEKPGGGGALANYAPSNPQNLRAKYRCGGSWGPTTSEQTDESGQFTIDVDCANDNWDGKITLTLNQTSKEQATATGAVTFVTARVDAKLEKCGGGGISGGNLDQGGGYWYDHGDTDGSGTASFFALPDNNVKLRMSYNHNSQTKTEPVVAGVNVVIFKATSVTLDYPGAIRSNKGGSWWIFDQPTMDLLPGDYDFWFKIGSSWTNKTTISVDSCTPISQSYALLKVIDENGVGVAGGKAKPACDGSWQSTVPGQTDANGNLFATLPTCYTKINMTVNQGGEEQTLAQLGASDYTWYTERVKVCLKDHAGGYIIDEAGFLRQGGGYWYNWGNLDSSGCKVVQLFPGSYKFEMNYNYTSETKDGIPVTDGAGIQEVVFQTGQVFGSCITQYASGTWRTFTDGMELMPGTYTFKSPSQSGTVTAGSVTYLTCS